MNTDLLKAISKDRDECRICASQSRLFDLVDFHGNVDVDPNGKYRKEIFPLSGIPIYFFKCTNCGLIYTRMFDGFSDQDFRELIYNQEWEAHFLGDPMLRGQQVASIFSLLFTEKNYISGLDYGGGSGHLSDALNQMGYAFEYYDPHYGEPNKPRENFNLITCIEVFEHVADVGALVDDLDRMCSGDGGVFFTTAVSDHLERCQGWIYCVPRSGHITFFSQKSLGHLFSSRRFSYTYLGVIRGYACHFAWRGDIPYLARKLVSA